MNPETRFFFGALLRVMVGTAVGAACGLPIAAFWPQPASPVVVDGVSTTVIWAGVFAGYAWGQAYLARVRRQ